MIRKHHHLEKAKPLDFDREHDSDFGPFADFENDSDR